MTAIARAVAQGIEDVMSQTRDLERRVSELGKGLDATRLAVAQDAFRQAAITWKRAGTFRDGPFQEQNALLRATRYPARARVIDAVLSESRPIDASRIAELGSGEKGLYAVEYLLFDSGGQSALARFQGPAGKRTLDLLSGLAAEVSSLAQKIQAALGTGASPLKDELMQSPQRALSRLVNTLIEGLEVMAEAQLGMIFRLSELNHLDSTSVEGFASRISHRLALARLEAAENFYRGGEHGISELVRATSPNADNSVRERFDNALSSLRAIDMPLEELAQRQRLRLQEAYLKVKSLETGMKVHLPSALGITITFSSTDAD